MEPAHHKPPECPWASCVLSFLLGALEGRAGSAFAEHLGDCASCSGRLQRIRTALADAVPEEERTLADDWSEERSTRVRRKVFDRIRAQLEDSPDLTP